MAEVYARCPKCEKVIKVDETKDAYICTECGEPIVTEKAIKLYENKDEKNEAPKRKKRHIWRSLGRGLWMVISCIGYLIYVLTFMWLIFDIADDFKK